MSLHRLFCAQLENIEFILKQKHDKIFLRHFSKEDGNHVDVSFTENDLSKAHESY
jgi:hypothetical protein